MPILPTPPARAAQEAPEAVRAPASATVVEAADPRLAAADAALAGGREAEALHLYREILADRPGEIAAHRGQALALARSGRLGQAVDGLLATADQFLDAELTEPADRLIATAIDLAPDAPRPHALAGRSAVVAREFARGARELARALELGDDDPRTRLYHGAALWELGRLDEALAVYRAAVAEAGVGRAAFLPLHQLGRLLVWMGRPEEAIAPLERAARLAPRAADTRMSLARALAEAGRLEPAIDSYRRAVELDPTSFHARWGLAQALLRQGDPASREEAARELETYRELYRADQEGSRAQSRLQAKLDEARRLLATGDAAAAAEIYGALGEVPDALAGLARARLVEGDRAAAIAALERAVALAPERRDLALLLADQRLRVEAERAEEPGEGVR